MEANLTHELAFFSPYWWTPRQRLELAPDLPWLTVLLDEDYPHLGPQAHWAVSAARAAADFLATLDLQPGLLEIWLEATPQVGVDAWGISNAFSDGVNRMALATGALPFTVAHEAAHYVSAQAAPSQEQGQGIGRLAWILLEEYLAQRIGFDLLGSIGGGATAAASRETRAQERQAIADYRATRVAFRVLIEQGCAPLNLREHIFALARTLAYLAGARAQQDSPSRLPRGLGRVLTQELLPALASIELPVDLRTNRLTLVARLGLDKILSNLLSEVATKALVATPRRHRHPNWPQAFGLEQRSS